MQVQVLLELTTATHRKSVVEPKSRDGNAKKRRERSARDRRRREKERRRDSGRWRDRLVFCE